MNEQQIDLREFLEEDVLTIDDFIKDHSYTLSSNFSVSWLTISCLKNTWYLS